MSCRHLIGVTSLIAGVFLVSTGCTDVGGYTTEPLFRDDVRTIALPIWTRSASVYRRDLEFRLTEALVKRIELDSPYRVADKSIADTMLEGEILAVRQGILSANPDLGTPRQLQVQLVVAYTWTDLRTGAVLLQQPRFVAAGVYSHAEPFDEDFFLGSAEAMNQLAEQIVETLEKPW